MIEKKSDQTVSFCQFPMSVSSNNHNAGIAEISLGIRIGLPNHHVVHSWHPSDIARKPSPLLYTIGHLRSDAFTIVQCESFAMMLSCDSHGTIALEENSNIAELVLLVVKRSSILFQDIHN